MKFKSRGETTLFVYACFDKSIDDFDIIDLPEEIVDKIDTIQPQFFKWLFDKKNNHDYWICEDGVKMYCSYGSEAFIDWLNNYILDRSAKKATIIERCSINIKSEYPTIHF